MHGINPNLIRSAYLGKATRDLLDDKGLSITEISEKIKLSRPSVSNALNGKIVGSDSMFTKILKAMGIKDSEVKEIFKKADQEEYKYKYGEEINTLEDIDFDVMLSRQFGVTDEQAIKDIKKYIKFIRDNK